jgi:hypothetical protein
MNPLALKLAVAILSFMMVTAPQTLPVGTALPIMMSSGLNAKSAKVGQKIEGRLMQDVPISSNLVIKKGSRVIGKVIAVQRPKQITVQFTQLQGDKLTIPLNVSLRALAAAEDVFQAAVPVGASTSESSDEWVTQQVGGDFVFRGRGYVSSDQGKVGRWNGNGVWGRLDPGADCTDADINKEEQALWVFSTSACGTYGYEKKLIITHDGHAAPLGQITLDSTAKNLEVRGGSGWMLLVNPPAKAGGGNTAP